MTNSPWGYVDNTTIINKSVAWVSTPGHGGVRVAYDYAVRFLSEEARAVGIRLGNFIYFEEDCDWAIVPWELITLHAKFHEHRADPVAEQRADLKRSVIRWNTAYALATGIIGPSDPLPEFYVCKGRGPHYKEHSLKRDGLKVVCTCGQVLFEGK